MRFTFVRRASVRLLATLSPLLTAAVIVPDAAARQFTPSAAFSVRRVPELWYNVTPADVNNDGIADLVAGGEPPSPGFTPFGHLRIMNGRGDGTFEPERVLAHVGTLLAVGDFTADGGVDLLAYGRSSTMSQFGIYIVPGHGNGTFGETRLVASFAPTFALVADFDRDGRTDVAVGEQPTSLHIYPGNGDLTFGARTTLQTGRLPFSGAADDFNGDGFPDIAVVNRFGPSLSIFLNAHGRRYRTSTIPLDHFPKGITTADVNGDALPDVVVTAADEDFLDWANGFVYVFLAQRRGAFGSPTLYEVERGAWTVAAGDFNRDGRVDIASGNRSFIFDDNYRLWDSVTILEGSGTGVFTRSSSFSLSDPIDPDDSRYRDTHNALVGSDLNRDGHADLVASPGVIMLNAPASANRAPTVFAGADDVSYDPEFVFLRAEAADADEQLLSFVWTDETGRVVGSTPNPAISAFGYAPGPHTFTVTVDDRHGGTASDSVTITVTNVEVTPFLELVSPWAGASVPATGSYRVTWFAEGSPLEFDLSVSLDDGAMYTPATGCSDLDGAARECIWTPATAPTVRARVRLDAVYPNEVRAFDVSPRFVMNEDGRGGTLPRFWAGRNVGEVAVLGASTYNGASGTFSIRASGAGVGGTADEGQFALFLSGPTFEIIARVAAVDAIDPLTKAGLMIRETLAPGARHISLFATATQGLVLQRRLIGDGTTTDTNGPPVGAPVWLRLFRQGDLVSAYYRVNETDPWTAVAHETIPGLSFNVQAGMFVSSHRDAVLATGTFDNVVIR